VLKERKRLTRPKSQPKVIRDLHPDFCINPDLDPDVCRITAKMSWIYYRLIDVLKKFHNGEGSGKVIGNPYPGPDHHQKLISSSNW